MKEKLVYLVVRFEMPIDNSPGLLVFPEMVFESEQMAWDACKVLDPAGEGLIYTCPSEGEQHYRSWDVQAIPYVETD